MKKKNLIRVTITVEDGTVVDVKSSDLIEYRVVDYDAGVTGDWETASVVKPRKP